MPSLESLTSNVTGSPLSHFTVLVNHPVIGRVNQNAKFNHGSIVARHGTGLAVALDAAHFKPRRDEQGARSVALQSVARRLLPSLNYDIQTSSEPPNGFAHDESSYEIKDHHGSEPKEDQE